MPPVVRTPQAEDDFDAIIAYLDEHSPAAAERLATAINQRCSLLGQFPEMGRAREELAPGIRSTVVEDYVIFYRNRPDAVQILRILHGKRDTISIMKSSLPEE